MVIFYWLSDPAYSNAIKAACELVGVPGSMWGGYLLFKKILGDGLDDRVNAVSSKADQLIWEGQSLREDLHHDRKLIEKILHKLSPESLTPDIDEARRLREYRRERDGGFRSRTPPPAETIVPAFPLTEPCEPESSERSLRLKMVNNPKKKVKDPSEVALSAIREALSISDAPATDSASGSTRGDNYEPESSERRLRLNMANDPKRKVKDPTEVALSAITEASNISDAQATDSARRSARGDNCEPESSERRLRLNMANDPKKKVKDPTEVALSAITEALNISDAPATDSARRSARGDNSVRSEVMSPDDPLAELARLIGRTDPWPRSDRHSSRYEPPSRRNANVLVP